VGAYRRIFPGFTAVSHARGKRHTNCDCDERATVRLNAESFGDYTGKGTTPMAMKSRVRQGVVSAAVFGAVVLMLVSVDNRVRERFGDLVSGGQNLSPWGDRAGDLVGALVSAVRYQSLENAPMLVYAAAGAVLVAFMLRT
jgi:hypothetical protein